MATDAIQTRITGLPHLAHPARADRREQFIRTEPSTRLYRFSGHSLSQKFRGRLKAVENPDVAFPCAN